MKHDTFRSLHVLHPEDDFWTGRRLLLAGIVPVTEPTGIGWPLRGAKSVGIMVGYTCTVPIYQATKVKLYLMLGLLLVDMGEVKCGDVWGLAAGSARTDLAFQCRLR